MAESKLKDLSMQFAVDCVKICESITSHRSLVNQLERSSTSIGANIHEANYAHSKADFIAKLQIALKECYETEYWLELFAKSGISDREIVKPLYEKCGVLRRILIASVNTAKKEYGMIYIQIIIPCRSTLTEEPQVFSFILSDSRLPRV